MIAKNQTIALPLRDLSDLLIPDPSPLSQGAVTPEAETYIIKKAKELSAKKPIRLTIELPTPAGRAADDVDLKEAITTHFRNAAKMEAVDIRELFRNGCRALLMGLLVLSTCLVLAGFLPIDFPSVRLRGCCRKASSFWDGSPCGGPSKYSCTNGSRSSGDEIFFCALATRP